MSRLFNFRKVFVALGCIVLLSLAAYFYMFHIVPEKEQELNRRGFRILARMEKNLHNKRINVLRNIDNVYGRRLRCVDGACTKNKLIRVDYFEGLDSAGHITTNEYDSLYSNNQLVPKYEAYEDRWSIYFAGRWDTLSNENGEIQFKEGLKETAYRYNAKLFFKDVLDYRDDFFHDYLVLQHDTVIYQSQPIVHTNQRIGNMLKAGSEHYPDKILFGDYVQLDTLNGQEYYVYLHPVQSATDHNFILCGLVPASEYREAKYILDPDQFVWAFIFLLLAICSVPCIKIYAVSRFERVFHTDIIVLGFALLGGAALVTVGVLLVTHTAAETTRQEKVLRAVGKDIRKRVCAEVDDILREIHRHEGNFNAADFRQWLERNAVFPYTPDTSDVVVDVHFNGRDAHHFTESLLLIGKEGNNWATWLPGNEPHPDLDLSKRDYVKAFNRGKPAPYSTLSGSDHGKAGFYMQPIYSWQNQENTVVVSTRPADPLKDYEETNIVALETRLFSVMKSAVPDELDFVVLDEAGEVLFHSDGKRNLKENFIDESDQRSVTREIIASHIDTTMSVYYYGRTYLAHFMPFENLPYTIVTLYDGMAYKSAVANEVSFTVLLLIMLLLLISTILLVTYFATRRPTLLQRQKMNLNWLRINPVNAQAFRMLNVALLVPTVISFLCIVAGSYLFVSFLLPIFTLAVATAVLYYHNASRYATSLYRNYIYFQYQVFYLLCLLAAVALLVLLLHIDPCSWTSFKFWFSVIIIVFLAVLAWRPDIVLKLGDFKITEKAQTLIPARRISLRWNFVASALILIMYNLSIFPALNFFTLSVHEEWDIAERRTSLQIANATGKRLQWIGDKMKGYYRNLPEGKKRELVLNGIYTPGDRNIVLRNRANMKKMIDHETKKRIELSTKGGKGRSLYGSLVNLPKISWNEYDLKGNLNQHLVSSDSAGLWWWDSENHKLNYKVTHRDVRGLSGAVGGITIVNTMFDNYWSHLESIQWWILVIAIALLFFFCYCMLVFLHKKLMLTEYFDRDILARSRTSDNNFIIHNLTKMQGNLLVISVPGSGVVEFITQAALVAGYADETLPQAADFDKHGVTYLYLKDTTDAQVNKYVLILPYFDLKAGDMEYCEAIVDMLAGFFREHATKVIWITSTDPGEQASILNKQYLEMYRAALKNKTQDAENYTKIFGQMRELLYLLDDFEKINYALQENPIAPLFGTVPQTTQAPAPGQQKARLKHFELTQTAAEPAEHYPLQYVDDEFRFGAHFKALRRTIMESAILDVYFKKDSKGQWNTQCDQAEEFFILKLQDMSQNYYYALWASLTSREKYVLYDLAQDDLTNYKNFAVLSELERKGILFIDSDDNALKIFNKSFQNFILSVVNPDEALILEKEINVQGTWDIVSTVLLILFVGIATFMFVTEQAFFNKIVLLTTGVTSLLPTLIRFFTPIKTAKETSGS